MCFVEFVLFLTHSPCVRWYHSEFLQPNSMAGNNSTGSGYAHDEDQGVEILRVSLLIQETALRTLAENVDRIFQAFEGHFDEIVDWLDALVLGANRSRNKGRRRLRDDVAQGQPVNKSILVYYRR